MHDWKAMLHQAIDERKQRLKRRQGYEQLGADFIHQTVAQAFGEIVHAFQEAQKTAAHTFTDDGIKLVVRDFDGSEEFVYMVGSRATSEGAFLTVAYHVHSPYADATGYGTLDGGNINEFSSDTIVGTFTIDYEEGIKVAIP